MKKTIGLSIPLIITVWLVAGPAGPVNVVAYSSTWLSGLRYSGVTIQDRPDEPVSNEDIECSDSADAIPVDVSIFKYYVSPAADAIQDLSIKVSSIEAAYRMAVQWVYVSDRTLHNADDKWLTPREFLAGSPDYQSNPVGGQPVSDCEEQASTLVSLLRAREIRPDKVRGVLGKVSLNGQPTGHVWVEIYGNGQWQVLDPTCGPYWDNLSEQLVPRKGLPFDYYSDHTYPVLDTWAYFNDVYQMNLTDLSGCYPDSWH